MIFFIIRLTFTKVNVMKSLKLFTILSFFYLFNGCLLDPVNTKKASFQIVYTDFKMWNDRPKLYCVFKNVGNITAYGVSVTVKAMDAFRGVLDTSNGVVSSGYSVHPGDTAEFTVVFYKLRSHEDYRQLQYNFKWEVKE